MLFYDWHEQYGKTEYMEAFNDKKESKYCDIAGWVLILASIDNREFLNLFRFPIKKEKRKHMLIHGIKAHYKNIHLGKFNQEYLGPVNIKVKIISLYLFKLGSTQTTGLGYIKFGRKREDEW